MINAQIDMTNFNRGIAGLINKVGLESRIVIKKETGELIKTLVRVTPKADPKNIRRDISGKFEMAGLSKQANQRWNGSGEVGPSGIKWYAWNEKFLFGVAPELDKRGASVSELKSILYTLTKKGRQNLPFKHPHKRQRVLLLQTVLTNPSTVNRLSAAKIKNRGRLAAGWLVSVFTGVIQITGSNKPPQYVMRHAAGARGYFMDGTGTPERPSFTIANTARGASNQVVRYVTGVAVAIRAKAMAGNALLYLRGKKNLADYAR
jgi:hypothetical protein